MGFGELSKLMTGSSLYMYKQQQIRGRVGNQGSSNDEGNFLVDDIDFAQGGSSVALKELYDECRGYGGDSRVSPCHHEGHRWLVLKAY